MKKVLYVDMDNTLVDFQSGLDRVSREVLTKYEHDEDDIPRVFALMDPMPGAVESFHELAELFDTYILSTAPWGNPTAWHDKLEWVQRHLGKEEGTPAYKRLILSHHKNLNVGDFLVDDRPKHRGVDKFSGEVLHFGEKGEYTTWLEVVAHLKGARMTSQLFNDATSALEDAHAYPMFSREYRAAVEHSYHLLRRVTMEVWNKEERDEARLRADSLLAYLAVPWEEMEAVEVRYSDGSTEVLYPTRDDGAAEKMRLAVAMRVMEDWDELDGA